MKKVKAVQDGDGHWYVIPDNEFVTFCEMEEHGDYEAFNERFSQYRTGGDLNLIQLYAEI